MSNAFSGGTELFEGSLTCRYTEVIAKAEEAETFDELVKYLLMVRKQLKDSKVDTELVYAYAKTSQLASLEEFISGTHFANLQAAGDRCAPVKRRLLMWLQGCAETFRQRMALLRMLLRYHAGAPGFFTARAEFASVHVESQQSWRGFRPVWLSA